MELGTRLELLRKKSGWSKTEVAKRIGLSSSTICKHEYGDREPDLDTICKYAELYDVSLEYLVGLMDDPNVSITMIASMNTNQIDSNDRFHEKDIADLKRFLWIFRVVAEYLFGVSNLEGIIESQRRISGAEGHLCEKDIVELKRFIKSFHGEM